MTTEAQPAVSTEARLNKTPGRAGSYQVAQRVSQETIVRT